MKLVAILFVPIFVVLFVSEDVDGIPTAMLLLGLVAAVAAVTGGLGILWGALCTPVWSVERYLPFVLFMLAGIALARPGSGGSLGIGIVFAMALYLRSAVRETSSGSAEDSE